MRKLVEKSGAIADCRLPYRVQAKTFKRMVGVLGFWLAVAGFTFGQSGEIKELGPTNTHTLSDPLTHGRGVGIINSIEFNPDWVANGEHEMLASSPWGGLFFSADGGETFVNAGTDGMDFPNVGKIKWFKIGTQDYWLITKGDYAGHWWSYCDGIYITPFNGTDVPEASDWIQIADRKDLGMFWNHEEETSTEFRVANLDWDFGINDVHVLSDNQGHTMVLVGTTIGMFRCPDVLSPSWSKVDVTGNLVLGPTDNTVATTPEFIEVVSLAPSIASGAGFPRIFSHVMVEALHNSNSSGTLSNREYPIHVHKDQKKPGDRLQSFDHFLYFSDDGGATWNVVNTSNEGTNLLDICGLGSWQGSYGFGVLRTSVAAPDYMYISLTVLAPSGVIGKIYRFETNNPNGSFTYIHDAVAGPGTPNEGPSPAHSHSLVLSPFLYNGWPLMYQGDVEMARIEFNGTSYAQINTDSPIRHDARYSLFEPGTWTESNYTLWTTWDGGLWKRTGGRTNPTWADKNSGLGVAALSYSHSAGGIAGIAVVGTQDCGSSAYNAANSSNPWTKLPLGGDGYFCDLWRTGTDPKYLVNNQAVAEIGIASTATADANSGPMTYTGSFAPQNNDVRGGLNNPTLTGFDLFHYRQSTTTTTYATLPNGYKPSSGFMTEVQSQGDVAKFRSGSDAFFVNASKSGSVSAIFYNTDFVNTPNGTWTPIYYGTSDIWNCDPVIPNAYLVNNPNSNGFVVDEELATNGKPRIWLLLNGCPIGRGHYYGSEQNYVFGRWRDRIMYYDGSNWSLFERSWPAGRNERITKLTGEPGDMDGIYATTHTRRLYYTNKYMTEWVEVGDRSTGKSLPRVLAQAMDIYHDGTTPANSRLRIGTWGRGLWEMPLVMAGLPLVSVAGVGGTCNQAVFTAEVLVDGQPITIEPGTIYGWRKVGTQDPLIASTELLLTYDAGETYPVQYVFVYEMPDGTWLAGTATGANTGQITLISDDVPLLTALPDCGGNLFKVKMEPKEGVGTLTSGTFSFLDPQGGAPMPLAGSDVANGLFTVYENETSFVQDGLYTVSVQAGVGCTVVGQFRVWGSSPAAYDSPVFKGDNFIHSNILVSFSPIAEDNAHLYFRGETRHYNDDGDIGGRVLGTTLTLDVKCQFVVNHNVVFTSHGTNCSQMWGGIRVPNGSNESRVDMGAATGSQINHAFAGIRLNSFEIGNDFVLVNEVEFNHCYIGIEFGLNGGKVLAGNELHVINSTFSSAAEDMKRPFDLARVGPGLPSNRFISQFGIFLNYKVLTNVGMIDNNTFTNQMVGVMTYAGQSQVDNCTFNSPGWLGVGMHEGLVLTTDGVSLTQGSHFHFAPTSLATPQKDRFIKQGKYFTETAEVSFSSFNYTPLANSCIGVFNNTEYSTQGSDFEVATRSQTGLQYFGLLYAGASGPPDLDANPSNDEDVKLNTFEGLDVGVRKYGTGKISIVANTFTDNLRAIELGYNLNGPAIGTVSPYDIDLNMKCNSFITDETTSRVGLLIENGVVVNGNGNIGGDADYDPDIYTDPYPNANYFPIKDESIRGTPPAGNQNVQAAWPEASNWQSIVNESANAVYYWRFFNEFVNNNLSALPGTVTDPPGGQLAHTVNPTANSVNPCPESNFPGTIIFPTRMAVNDSSSLFTAVLPGKGEVIWLANPVPNPAIDLVNIGVYLPGAVQSARLQVLDAMGKVMQSSTILERGKVVIEMKITTAPAGTYLIRLFCDGHISPIKKLVVTH